MSAKMVTSIYYWNGKIINCREGLAYEGPPSVAIVIRPRVSFYEFMDKLHQVTGHDKSSHG